MQKQNLDEVDHDELANTIKNHYTTSVNNVGVNLPLFVHGPPGIGKSETAEQVGREIAAEQDREFVMIENVVIGDDDDMGSVAVDREQLNEYLEGSSDSSITVSEIIESAGSTDETTENPDNDRVTVAELKKNPENYFLFADQRLAQEDPTTSRGIPDVSSDNTSTVWKPPKWLNSMTIPGISGLLFADEMNQAQHEVQVAYYELINKQKLGSNRLASNVFAIGAGNRDIDEAGVKGMKSPLRNRFAAHVELQPPTSESWVEWAREVSSDQSTGRQIDPSIISFIESNIGRQHLFEDISDNPERMAFATPRTWEFAGQLLADLEGRLDANEASRIVERAVGSGPANAYRGYLNARDELDVEKYMEDPSEAKSLKSTTSNVSTIHALRLALSSEFRVALQKDNNDEPYKRTPVETLEKIIQISQYQDPDDQFALLTTCAEIAQQNDVDFTMLMHQCENEEVGEIMQNLLKFLG